MNLQRPDSIKDHGSSHNLKIVEVKFLILITTLFNLILRDHETSAMLLFTKPGEDLCATCAHNLNLVQLGLRNDASSCIPVILSVDIHYSDVAHSFELFPVGDGITI